MKMYVTAKSVYGETKIYPLCEVAKAYAEAIGTKTLTQHALKCAKRMGYEISLDAGVSIAVMLAA